MNPRRKSRLYLAIVVLIGIALTATLMLYALRSNIDLFYTPRSNPSMPSPSYRLSA